MPFSEDVALEVSAMRAVETAGAAESLWSEEDRAWASRAAAEVVGEGAAPETFLATRAGLVLARAGERAKALPRAVAALRWRPWVGILLVAAAFAAGAAIDQVGGTQRINLLAPPLFGLLVWNLAVYAALGIGYVLRYGDPAPVGPLRRIVARAAAGKARPGRSAAASAIAKLALDWALASSPLYSARAARLLHLAAAAFAAGLVGGLYVRGLAFEYRASWESTFLSPDTVRALLAGVLAPGAALTGIPVPPISEVAAIRAPGAENAARWLHLMAATAAVVVILPRLVLAAAAGLIERHRAAHLAFPLDAPYMARLLRGYRGGPIRVEVLPYSYTMPAAANAGLERLLRGVFGANAALTIRAPTAYGAEDALDARASAETATGVIALFNATATPEREAHGAFLEVLARRLAPGGTLAALIDESAFRGRLGDDPARLEARRASWRSLCEEREVPCAFAMLAAGELADAQAELERALEARAA